MDHAGGVYARVITLQFCRRLHAAGLPADSPRLHPMFEALHECPAAERQALAKLVNSVVDALIDPKTREAMWAKVDSLSPEGWRNLAAKKSRGSSGRHRKGVAGKPDRERQVRTVLLGVVGQAVQGAGHFQLELERLVKEGATQEASPVCELLQRLADALKDAERNHPSATAALKNVAGKVLAVVEEHSNRVPELVSAFQGAKPELLRRIAQRLHELREEEQDRRTDLIRDLGLAVVDSEALEEIVGRIVSLPAFASYWEEQEQAAARTLLVHLRQGEQLRGEEDVTLADRTSTNKRRHVRAYARASHLMARLLLTERKDKTRIWWERIVRSSLREIEIDSLGAKRFRAGSQQRMAAKALEAVSGSASAKPRDETTAKLTGLIDRLQLQLTQRPHDPRLENELAQTKQLLSRHQAQQKERTRQRLARLANADGASPEEEDWLSDMD